MIIQHYDFAVRERRRPVYDGDDLLRLLPSRGAGRAGRHPRGGAVRADAGGAGARPVVRLSRTGPVPGRRWRMVDRIDAFVPDGGPARAGVHRGDRRRRSRGLVLQGPFPRDPVWPGSLGLESFLQLLKVVAAERWGLGPDAVVRLAGAGPAAPLDLPRPGRCRPTAA